MSGSSNNSWTIVTPEETAAAETLRPLTQGTARQEEPSAPAEGANPSESSHGLSEEDQSTLEEKGARPHEGGDASSLPSSAPSEDQSSPVLEPQTGGSALSSMEPEAFSDSYTDLSPSSEETPAPALTTETLGHLDSGQEEEEEEARAQTDVQDETQHQTVRQELQSEEEESKEETQPWSPIETPHDPTVHSTAPEAEPELRRRRLAALERIGRHDEDEEVEENFQVPQRDDDSSITLNKCILGAVILLGLGTIFISGVFMDPDEENDYPPVELKDSESSLKPEWLNADVSQPGAEAGSAELLSKLTKGNEQLEILQAQLQSQNEELKVATAQAAEGSAERLEEVQKENSRLMESVPVLQKELEKMRIEMESVSVLQKEVETLRSALTHLKFYAAAATTPPSGGTEDGSQSPAEVYKKEKPDKGVTKEWKDAEKSKWKKEEKQRKDGGKTEGKEKEWKKEKSEGGKSDERRKDEKHSKQSDETKEWKKDKAKRGDEGMPWKEKKEKKESYEGDKKYKRDKSKEERSKEERDVKESKYYQEKHKGPEDKHWKRGRDEQKKEKKEGINEGDKKHKREWKSKEDRDFRESKYYQEKHKGPGDKRSKEGRDEPKEERKEKYEKKHWKERNGYEGQNKKDDGERSKYQKKWEKEDKKEWMREEDRFGGGSKGKKYEKEWHGDKREEHRSSEHQDHTWTDKKPAHSHPKPAVGRPEYWSRQRARVQHSAKPQDHCDSADSCARAEGLRPVHFTEFESVLKNYLSKAQTAGVEASQIDELQKLAAEMFENGFFPHDRVSFLDFVEDIGDVLEDLVEGDDDDDGQEDGTVEDEMEGFEEEVMQKFMLSAELSKDGEKGRG